MGCGALQDRASGCRNILVSAGLGPLAPRVRRLLHAGRWRSLRKPLTQNISRQVDVPIFRDGNERLDLFEDMLAYDNARLPQALIQTGLTTRTRPYVEVGLRSLRWLMSLQTASSGCFRPIGNKSFGRIHQKPEAFDQQPIEASATISASLA